MDSKDSYMLNNYSERLRTTGRQFNTTEKLLNEESH
jgi:hypothetical protein